jgi:hypothetical protein
VVRSNEFLLIKAIYYFLKASPEKEEGRAGQGGSPAQSENKLALVRDPFRRRRVPLSVMRRHRTMFGGIDQ